MPPLNVLYIHAHDAGRLIAPYGHAMPTPNLTRLAAQGMLFRRAFCCGPTCSPSRAALLTGQSPHATGMLGLAHRGFSLSDYDRHIVSTLKPAGYTTLLSGVQHVAAWDQVDRIGYDEILTRDGHADAAATAAVARLAAGIPEPFFMSVGCIEPQRCVRTDRWKYVRRYGDKHTPVLPNCDDGLSKDVFLAAGWAKRTLPGEALYDMLFDPTESHNVIGDPGLADAAADLRQRLDRWMAETNDPLLQGPVAAPSGAKVNDPDGLSPKEPPQEIP
ncbi:MAG: sulfatase-like hydrolase/transferase [Planctomycetes bacterium]|nr:sulfatase-like hydrolase/transferase [Planctomycetota bacterium]